MRIKETSLWLITAANLADVALTDELEWHMVCPEIRLDDPYRFLRK
jgi:hypothetical protein